MISVAPSLRLGRILLVFAAALALAQPLHAQGPVEDGRVAYDGGDYARALELLQPQAEQSHPEAQYLMGMMYRFGWGVDKDMSVALRWFEAAAAQDHAAAQSELGKMHKDGRGVPADAAEAVKWFERAAYGGEGVAQLNLGRMYLRGNGVEKDAAAAYAWFSIAIDHEYMDAMGHRNRLRPKMSADELANGKALADQIRDKMGKR